MIGPFHKTRFAPTPSGYLHLGNVFSFALTANLAEKSGANILLRIDDMDRERANTNYISDIFETLHFLDLPWTEGPKNKQELEDTYSQRHRLSLYTKALNKLRDSGLLYACNCSRMQIRNHTIGESYTDPCRHKGLSLDAADVAWRLNTDERNTIPVKEIDGSILYSSLLGTNMQDVVVRKKDGFPAYQLSSIVDDVLFGTDLIVRGKDLWHSTLVQLHIASLLNEEAFLNTTFYHHDLLLDKHQRKLSKSAGDTSVHYLRKQGLPAKAIYARLGEELQLAEPVRHWRDLASLLSWD